MKPVRAIAHSNIALSKYWGKADVENNLPAVPSLSLTLDGLSTTTDVCFDPALADDVVELDGGSSTGKPRERIVELLDRVRARAKLETRARVESRNDFPTAAGLASSASGFAALALAATRAAGLELDAAEVSSIARRSSASAARSLFGGFVSLGASAERAERVAPAEHFPVVMLVAITASGPKSIGSTEAMNHTKKTSPYYPSWVEHSPTLYEEVKASVLARDIERLGAAMEQSALMMHASMMASGPAVLYWTATSVAVIHRVRELRASGPPAFFTMDGGPHVKVLTEPAHAEQIARALEEVAGVQRVLRCAPGPDARLISEVS